MKKPVFTIQFNKDLKLCEKRTKDIIKIKAVMFDLICENPLSIKHNDHALSGNYKHHRECHIEPDWLLIYRYEKDEVHFITTGTHSDLFK